MQNKSRSNYGISRIDQPDKKNHGFYVRITHNGTLYQRYFPDKASGGKTKALNAAKEYRDEVVAKLPKYKQDAINSRRKKILQSGVTGVTHVVAKAPGGKKVYEYWQAAWDDAGGNRRTAKFSISRYGNKEALEMAKKARNKGARGGTVAAPKKKKAAAKPKASAKKKASKKKASKKRGKK